jgi:hypothetical protein
MIVAIGYGIGYALLLIPAVWIIRRFVQWDS